MSQRANFTDLSHLFLNTIREATFTYSPTEDESVVPASKRSYMQDLDLGNKTRHPICGCGLTPRLCRFAAHPDARTGWWNVNRPSVPEVFYIRQGYPQPCDTQRLHRGFLVCARELSNIPATGSSLFALPRPVCHVYSHASYIFAKPIACISQLLTWRRLDTEVLQQSTWSDTTGLPTTS